jgi:hypothetical protein
MPLHDVITAPKSLSEENAAQQRLESVQEAVVPPKKAKQPSHHSVEELVKTGRAGHVPAADRGKQWRVTAVNLIGLVKHAEPTVYLTGKAKDPKDIKTRELDDFETSALDALRNGEDLKAEKDGAAMRAVGPIYAGKRCTACHERGLFLGAFSYRLELAAAPKDGEAGPFFPLLAP